VYLYAEMLALERFCLYRGENYVNDRLYHAYSLNYSL